MNTVSVIGTKGKEAELAYEVISWCINKLMPRLRTLDILVSFEKIDAFGYCMEEDGNREFTITIRKGLPIQELIGTLVHEMIHVKQYARKELRNINGQTLWKKSDFTGVDYADAPWEKEAYELEAPLTMECFMSLKFTL